MSAKNRQVWGGCPKTEGVRAPGSPIHACRRGVPLAEHDDNELLTLDEAADEFGVSRRTLERLRQQKLLPGIRRGRYLWVRRGDVRRALAFSDPIQLLRHQITATPDLLVEQWMEGWMQLTSRLDVPDGTRKAQRRWTEEASRRYGSWTISEYQIRHALDAAEAAQLDGSVAMLVMAMRGMPEDMPVIQALRSLVPLLNPLIEHDGHHRHGDTDGRGDGDPDGHPDGHPDSHPDSKD